MKRVTKIKKKMQRKDLKLILNAIREVKKYKSPKKSKKRLRDADKRIKHLIRHKKKSTKKTYWLLGI